MTILEIEEFKNNLDNPEFVESLNKPKGEKIGNDFGGREEYRIYIPDEITNDTEIIIAGHGADGMGDLNTFYSRAEIEKPNAIIITPVNNDSGTTNYSELFSETGVNIALAMREKYGNSDGKITTYGFSQSGVRSYETAYALATTDKYDGPIKIYSTDSFCASNSGRELTDEQVQKLIDRNATQIVIHSTARLDEDKSTYAKHYAEMGLKTIEIEVLSDGKNAGHGEVNGITTSIEVLENNEEDYSTAIEYIDAYGNIRTSDNIEYRAKIYDTGSGKWIPIPSQIAKKIIENPEENYSISFIINEYIKSGEPIPTEIIDMLITNSEYLETYLNSILEHTSNNIIDIIKSDSESLNTIIESIKSCINQINLESEEQTNYTSTTNVPTCEPYILNTCINNIRELINKLIQELCSVQAVEEAIEADDKKLSNEIQEIGG